MVLIRCCLCYAIILGEAMVVYMKHFIYSMSSNAML